MYSTSTALKWRPRLGIYANSNKSCTFDPVAAEARSYGHYIIAGYVNGLLVLNTYSYSQTTNRHMSMVSSLLKQLGHEFIQLEGPGGLPPAGSDVQVIARTTQIIRRHYLHMYATDVIREKYARIKWANGLSDHWAERMALLTRIGISFETADSLRAFVAAEDTRTKRLARNRCKRLHGRSCTHFPQCLSNPSSF